MLTVLEFSSAKHTLDIHIMEVILGEVENYKVFKWATNTLLKLHPLNFQIRWPDKGKYTN